MKLSLATTHDGSTWDATRWYYDHAGVVTNKTYADDSSVNYTYTSNYRPLRTTWARGEWKENSYNHAGQLESVAYSDDTPDAFYAYSSWGYLTSFSNTCAQYIIQNNNLGIATNITANIGTHQLSLNKVLDNRMRLYSLESDWGQSPIYYDYNNESALNSVSNSAWSIEYLFDRELDAGYVITLTNSTAISTLITHDPHRRSLITGITNLIETSVHSSTEYSYDLLGNVLTRNNDQFNYNSRSEIIDAVLGSNRYNYKYDHMGNNCWVSINNTTNYYTANNLNQYTSISAPSTSLRELQYDLDGNLLSNGSHTYTWDAENRLTFVTINGASIIQNSYDPQHRRVIKTTPTKTHTLLYDGWLPIVEKIVHSNNSVEIREHVWGKDLSGSREGAGGVGGLLATRIDDEWYFPLYDNNGNITDYINESGITVAHREYDSFGNTIASSGTMVDTLNFWYSTKYLDHETSHYYYGYRFYDPALMRWLNRDPIGEKGGLNIYGFAGNNGLNKWDKLGEFSVSTGDYSQLAKALLDFLNGGPAVSYSFNYPDSVTKRLLNHHIVSPIWDEFTQISCKGKEKRVYYKEVRIEHKASLIDFFIDIHTLWGLRDAFGNPNWENVMSLDFGVRLLGSFKGDATITLDCEKCEKHLAMTIKDSFTMASLTRNPFNRNQSLIKSNVLNPINLQFNYNIKEKIK